MRSNAREAAFKVIFARLLGGNVTRTARENIYKQEKLNEDDKTFAERLISTTVEHEQELSDTIASAVTRFVDYRIYTADKAILLISLAEIKYFDDVPPIVTANEGTTLAQKFSTEKSADFVNGVLGGIINS